MLSSAIIVFREVFEIVLIVGIVLAATSGIPHRKKAIAFGFGGGLLGSALVALLTGEISNLAEGLGQEYFNASVLFVAAAFIGWTVIWMKKHAREMKAHFTKIGNDVSLGRLPFVSLSVVIALAMVREGSEISLFAYGMLASGQSALSLFSGAAIGLVGGVAIGTMLYMGLIKLSTKHFFQITSWLLVLLVAGMMSQGIGFLTQAGLFEHFSRPVWDSSWLLSERSIAGQSLKALMGYTAHPSVIQLIVYAMTISTLTVLMKQTGRHTATPAAAAAIILALGTMVMIPGTAHATKQVYRPYVEQGEREIEWKGGYDVDHRDSKSGAWKQKLAIGYGVNAYWATELYGEVEKDGASGSDPQFSAVEWENRFQLTQPGEYWADLGALAAYEYNATGGPDKIEIMALVAKDIGQFSHTANFILEKEIGAGSGDAEGGLAWSSRYRYRPEFEPGFEMHNNFGSLSENTRWDDQGHQIGPVIYGTIRPQGAGRAKFKYDIGYLVGVSKSAPDGTLKAILEYEF